MNLNGSKESEFQIFQNFQRELFITIEFLIRLGGNDLRFNEYQETIHKLQGIKTGIKLSENSNERIEYEKIIKETK